MSQWTHAICGICWLCLDPENLNREPHKLRYAQEEACCFCGQSTKEGIYIRYDPKQALCKGQGVFHEEVQE